MKACAQNTGAHLIIMYPPQRSIAHNALSSSNLQTIYVSHLPMSPGMFNSHHLRNSSISQSRRSFWWSRKSPRVWTSYLDESFQKHIEARQRMLKHKCAKASQRNSLWEREYPVSQHRPSWGWRLSSSWGKPGGRWVNFDELPKQRDADEQKNPEEPKLEPWYSDLQSSQELFRRKMAEVRRRVDEDPFKAIFGGRIERARIDWSPLFWGLARKAEREAAVVEESPTRTQPPSRPTEKTKDGPKTATYTVSGNAENMNQRHPSVPRSEAPKAGARADLKPTAKPKDTRHGDSSLSSSWTTEDFMIDPITLRKVPRIAENSTWSDEEPTNIPIKKFAGYRSQPDNPTEADHAQDTLQTELSKYKASSGNAESASTHEAQPDPVAKGLEDYELRVSNESESPEATGPAETGPAQESPISQSRRTETKLQVPDFDSTVQTIPRSRSQPPQIESSLSRSLRNGAQGKSKAKAQEDQKLHYSENESTVEDLDLLRASDVRAASGLAGRPRRETDEEKQQRRRKLEDDFNKPQALETQFAEEVAAQTIANLKENRSQELLVPETDGFGYDLTPRGLETSYERELQNRVQNLENSYSAQVEREEAALREAEVDGFDRRPQGLETSFAREQESKKAQGRPLAEVATYDALPEILNAAAARRAPQGLESPSPLEHAAPSSQAVEQHDGGHHRFQGSDHDSTSRVSHSLPVGKVNQSQGEGDISVNVHDFAVRDRWYKKQAPRATTENPNITSEGLLAEDIMPRTDGAQEASESNIPHESSSMSAKDGTRDASLEGGLEAYDSKLGRQAYCFQTGQDSLEADILAQSQPQTVKRVGDKRIAPYSGYLNPEALAMRWEQEEQKLHEEIRETNDVLSEAKAELWRIMASKEMSKPLDKSERKASESLESAEQSLRPSTIPNAKLSEVERQITHAMNLDPPMYTVLAYDHSTENVVTIPISSFISPANEAPISLGQALSRLTHPAKFLPRFSLLQSGGFEVVSAGKHFLVFKKVPGQEGQAPIVDATTERGFSERRRPMNPIDGTTTQTGNFASPTGFVNHDVVFPSPFAEESSFPHATSSRTGGRVRREEDVFSGSSKRWWDESIRPEKPRGRVGKVAKRVFWVGAWTAGCFYAVGVVAEFFRTGGADGLGAQDF